ncbi:MAG: tetratricopeptide repeat protein, partial [Gammaproteobacteria bacterium]|nr:tetratricopeptide repeat protein [Gammaproteobacteria bacterium]
ASSELQQTIKPLLYNTALSLRESRKFNQAFDAVSALAEQKHALFNELNLAGILALDTNQYRLAQQYLLRAIELNPEHSGARQNLIIAEAGAFGEWLTLSRQRLKEGRLSAAEKALAKAAQLQSGNSKVATLKSRIAQQRLANAADQFFKARIALESGDLPVALDHVNAGLAIKPNDRDGLMLRQEISDAMAVDLDKLLAAGLQDLQSGNLGSADQAFRKILAIAPQHQETLAAKDQLIQARKEQRLELQRNGQRAIDSGQTERAIQLFNQLLAMDPENMSAKQGLNSARQMRANRVDELIRNGRQAADRAEYSKARQWFEQARSIEDTKRTQSELKALSREITAKADKYAEQANRAVVKNNLSQAKKLYAKALALDPGHEASIVGQKALAAKTEQIISTRLKRADNAFRKGAYPEAIKVYRAVLDLDANQTAAIDGLKRCREAQAEELAQLVENGETALDNGDFETAEEMLTKALQQDAYHKQAQQLRQKLDLMQQAGAQPGDEQKLYLQGVAYYTQGKYTEAIKSWETVLLLDPDHEKSRQNITKARLKMRHLKEFSGD